VGVRLCLSHKGKTQIGGVRKRELKRIFGPKRDEVTGGWRKLHHEELNNFYSSPNIIIMANSWRMRSACRVARRGR
jgi:hypothetical protein